MSVPTHTKALDLAYIALMAALIALCAWISVPLGPVRSLLPCRPLASSPLWGFWGAGGEPWPF